jgi:small subunit ribosomal protein S20
MPNIQSAFKRMRTSAKKRTANYSTRNEVHSFRNKLYEAIASGQPKAKCQEMYKAYCSLLDKGAKRGIVPKNTADRAKSRAALRVAKLTA